MLSFSPFDPPRTRDTALAAAKDFAPHAGSEYSIGRNHVLPGNPKVSRLAPAIRVRLLLESEAAQIVLDEHGSLEKCEKFVQEIHWRSYWRSWLELRPSVWDRYVEKRDSARDGLAKVQLKRIEQIESGESGVEPIDNFVRELVETGYLHNHARMWLASFWVHAERLPYELGSEFFERHLTCACPASNTLSWRWIAGLQTRGKAYLARRSNLDKYCDAAYMGDEIGLERLEDPREAPLPAGEENPDPQPPDFQKHLSELSGKIGLWISEDDLAPETSELQEAGVAAICTSVVGAPHLSASSNGTRREYRLAAARDAGGRAQANWSAPASNLEAATSKELAEQISNWARENEVQQVVTLKPFVGPSGDALPSLRARLEDAGIELQMLRREEDARMLGFARSGYFKFWQGVKKSGGVA